MRVTVAARAAAAYGAEANGRRGRRLSGCATRSVALTSGTRTRQLRREPSALTTHPGESVSRRESELCVTVLCHGGVRVAVAARAAAGVWRRGQRETKSPVVSVRMLLVYGPEANGRRGRRFQGAQRDLPTSSCGGLPATAVTMSSTSVSCGSAFTLRPRVASATRRAPAGSPMPRTAPVARTS
jgi:hypothetical protein